MEGVSWLFVLIAMCILSPVESFIPGYNATHEINGLLKAKREARSNLRWAYNEAVALCKQYGELLEDMRDFLQTGTSGVGECSLLIEQDLTRQPDIPEEERRELKCPSLE
jgi:hypothetical protein